MPLAKPKPLQVPATNIDPDFNAKFSAARIPLIYRDVMLSSDPRFKVLSDYMTGEVYPADYEAATSINLVCSPMLGVVGFALLARSMVVKLDSVMYVTLYDLYMALTGEGEKVLAAVKDADILFVTDFYDRTHDFPFTANERYLIEGFLSHRIKRNQRNALYTPIPLDETGRWWSEYFIAQQVQNLRKLVVV